MPNLTRESVFAYLAIAVSVIRYGTYLRSIYKKETRPHSFSWFIWGLVTGIGAIAQSNLDGGPSVWVLALVAISCFMISVLAIFVGEKNITRSDWIALMACLLAIIVWQLTSDPTLAIICVIGIDAFSYWPTIRKSWSDPASEPPKSYFWAGLRYFLTLFAVPTISLTTLAYPFWLMAGDWGFMLYVIWRRRVIEKIG